MPYIKDHDILIQRINLRPNQTEYHWRVFAPNAVGNLIHEMPMALDLGKHLAAEAGVDLYRQESTDAEPELVERVP